MAQTHQARRLFRIQGVPIMGKDSQLIEENRKLNEETKYLREYYKKMVAKLQARCASLGAELELARASLPTNEKTLQAKCASLEAELEQARAELVQLRRYHAPMMVGYNQAIRLLEGDYEDKQLVHQLKVLFGVVHNLE